MPASCYRGAKQMRVRFVDDDALVFNPLTWETHFLNPAAALVLECAVAAPCTEAEVRDLLTEVLDEAQRPLAAEHARSVLAQLVALGLLIEQAEPRDADR